jgi:hypothetical protein
VESCSACGEVFWSNTRIDRQSFWVGAMGRHVSEMERELVAELRVPSSEWTADSVGKI